MLRAGAIVIGVPIALLTAIFLRIFARRDYIDSVNPVST